MIRLAQPKDLISLMDIYNDAILNTTATFDTEIKDIEDRKKWFFDHHAPYVIYVYESEGSIAGYASLSQYRDRKAFDRTTEISVYIHKDYQGMQIGSQLLEKTLDHAKQSNDFTTIISLITGNNEKSIRLHNKFNFEYCGKIKNAGIKFGEILDLNIYELIL